MMTARMPDGPRDTAALVARAQDGDERAFEALVVEYADRLHAVVRRLMGNDHDAKEVTQEAFLRAWRGLRGFQGDAQFYTWLYRIGVNEANRRLTSRSGASSPARSLDDLAFEPRDPGPGPDLQSEHRELRAALEAAVAALHPDYRTPLVLRDVEGLSTQEAAELMGLGEAAFKSRLHRARMLVRDALASEL